MVLKFKNQLKGDRLTLKRSKPIFKVAESKFKLIDENRKHLDPWVEWSKLTLKVEDVMKYLFDNEEKTKKGRAVEYGVFIKNELVGAISLFDISEKDKSAEIGYWISSSHAGRGYTTEAVRILEKYAFENLKLNRIQIQCDEKNKSSAGVAKSCGYILEGTLRDDSFSVYFNQFRNTLVFSKLKSEYKKK